MTLHSSHVIPCYNAKSVEILSRFKQRAAATNIEESILNVLADVGLSIADICGITTDGDNTMVKLGKLLTESAHPKAFYHQQCLAHALHLAVRDTLSYPGEEKKQWKLVAVPPEDAEGKYRSITM